MQAQPQRFIVIGLLAAVAAALLGCASTQGAGYGANAAGSNQKTAALPGKAGCFWLSRFDGSWTPLNSSELLVYAPTHSQPYLIKLFEPVPSLTFDVRLGFEDVERTHMICDGSMDYLLVPHWQPHRIPIVAVRELTVPEEQHLLGENHIKGPRPAKAKHVASR